MLGNVAVEPAGTVRPAGRRRMRLPGTSVSLPGITLSDEGSQGERARTRRSACRPALDGMTGTARRPG